ncbi:MAG TPA: NADPH:quinone oxidoreductase family protein [Acidimicrobiales bacterium]|nr:NADPH:quinone oxidoreductase family protein [Acidimicrobiales bacterium]
MRAAQIVSHDGPTAMKIGEAPDPTPRDGEVLIETHVAGVTFPDLLMTRGEYQMSPEFPFVPGSEVAGTVRSAPEGSGFSPGDRVVGFPGTGGFAELTACRAEAVFPLPENFSFAQGAALPMNYLTCEFALGRRGRLAAGETVLVHGAAGGIGTAAIQLAKAAGGRVIAVVSSEDKAQVARNAGADDTVMAEGFLPAVKELTGGRGVDVIVDPVGGDRFIDSLRSLAPEGRLLVVGFTGREIPTVKVNRLLLTNTEVVGVGWGAMAFREPGFMREQWERMLPLIASGAIDPPLGSAYPLEKAPDALIELDERRATGKVTIELRPT